MGSLPRSVAWSLCKNPHFLCVDTEESGYFFLPNRTTSNFCNFLYFCSKLADFFLTLFLSFKPSQISKHSQYTLLTFWSPASFLKPYVHSAYVLPSKLMISLNVILCKQGLSRFRFHIRLCVVPQRTTKPGHHPTIIYLLFFFFLICFFLQQICMSGFQFPCYSK